MPKKIAKAGIKKKPGYLYFLDKQGDISAAKLSRFGKAQSRKQKKEKIKKLGIKKKPGYLYFIDKQGDVSAAKMQRGRSKK